MMASEVQPAHIAMSRLVDFDMYAPPNLQQGFQEAWSTLHQNNAPDLVWTPRNGGHWIATRGEMIRKVLSQPAKFSSRVAIVPKASGQHYHTIPLTIDPPAHRAFRNLFNANLSPKAVGSLRGAMRELAAKLTETMRLRGFCDFVSDYAHVLPVNLFLTMVKLPVEDAEHIFSLMEQLTRPNGAMTFEQAMQGFYDYLGPLVDRRKGNGEGDLLSSLINGNVDGRPVTREEAIQLGANALMGGTDTVTNFLGFIMLSLARDPDQQRALANDSSLIAPAVDEFLRRFPIVVLAREVTDDFFFEGVEMKRGEMIVLPTPLHGLDPLENECPMEVDFNRASREHCTFGDGIHRCAGALLARTEIQVVIEEWFARIPEFRLAADAKIAFKAGTIGCVESLQLVWDVAGTRGG
jgi:camphor 5-monooxygenase